MESSAIRKKKPLSAKDREALLRKYEQVLKDDGGLAREIEQPRVENTEFEALIKKNPRRLMGGCG